MKHKDFETLRREEENNNSLNISDIVEEQDLDDQNTSNINSLHPCRLCKDDDNYCCCGVFEECEYLITEEGLSIHIMNQHEPSDVITGLGQEWAKDITSFVIRNPDSATDRWQTSRAGADTVSGKSCGHRVILFITT